MEFKSTRQGNSVYDEIKSRLFEQKLLERQTSYEKFEYDDELDESLNMIEDEYIFNLFKLDEILLLGNKTEELKRRFFEQKLFIESSDISEKQKVNAILTTACLLSRIYEQVKNFNVEQLYTLSFSMAKTDLKNYHIYGKVLSDNHFKVRAYEMSRDNNGIVELEEDAFMFCDECNGCELSDPTYQKAMKLVLPVLLKNNYEKLK